LYRSSDAGGHGGHRPAADRHRVDGPGTHAIVGPVHVGHRRIDRDAHRVGARAPRPDLGGRPPRDAHLKEATASARDGCHEIDVARAHRHSERSERAAGRRAEAVHASPGLQGRLDERVASDVGRYPVNVPGVECDAVGAVLSHPRDRRGPHGGHAQEADRALAGCVHRAREGAPASSPGPASTLESSLPESAPPSPPPAMARPPHPINVPTAATQ
jgi:hypothetical protein